VTKKYELEYDDATIGHPELGMMTRDDRIFTGADGYDAEQEDEAYQRFLKQKGINARVVEGTAYVDG